MNIINGSLINFPCIISNNEKLKILIEYIFSKFESNIDRSFIKKLLIDVNTNCIKNINKIYDELSLIKDIKKTKKQNSVYLYNTDLNKKNWGLSKLPCQITNSKLEILIIYLLSKLESNEEKNMMINLIISVNINCSKKIYKIYHNFINLRDNKIERINIFKKIYKNNKIHDNFKSDLSQDTKKLTDSKSDMSQDSKSDMSQDSKSDLSQDTKKLTDSKSYLSQDTEKLTNMNLNILYNINLKYKDLIIIIYQNFDNFESIIPYLVDFDKYMKSNNKDNYSVIGESGDVKICVRSSVFSLGTYILLKKYKGLFSQLIQFLYFCVHYLIEKKITLEKYDFLMTIEMHKYVLKYVPFITLCINSSLSPLTLKYLNILKVDNNFEEHLFTGSTYKPHFFISSTPSNTLIENKVANNIKNNYLNRIKTVIDTIDTNIIMCKVKNINLSYYPVLIYINIKNDNKAYYQGYEEDYVFCPYIKSEYIDIRTEDGNIFDYEEIYKEHIFLGGKKSIKKEFFGKNKIIYKLKGDRKEYVKHKGILITIKEYRLLMTI
jgi:hypothetical protein